MQRAVQPGETTQQGVIHRPRTDATQGQQTLADQLSRGLCLPLLQRQVAGHYLAAEQQHGLGLGLGEPGLAQLRLIQRSHRWRIRVTQQATGMWPTGQLDQLAAQRDRHCEADLLTADGPAQGLEGRARLRHAQARCGGDQHTQLRMLAVAPLELLDRLGQPQHVLDQNL